MGVEINPLPNFANKKVLPAAYDDSLSYYELNAKVLSKTNEVVEQVNANTAIVDAINSEWPGIKSGAQEATASANAAAASATSGASAANAAAENANQVATTYGQTLSTLDARVSTIIANGQQTEGNTELIDIRTGWKGITYPTAGDAVRGQFSSGYEDFAYQMPAIANRFDGTFLQGYYDSRDLSFHKSDNFVCNANAITVTPGETLYFLSDHDYTDAQLLWSTSDGQLLSAANWIINRAYTVPAGAGKLYLYINFGRPVKPYDVILYVTSSQVTGRAVAAQGLFGTSVVEGSAIYGAEPVGLSLTTGRYINSLGVIKDVADANFSVSDSIPCAFGEAFLYQGSMRYKNANYAVYDAGMNLIRAYAIGNGESKVSGSLVIIDAPGAAYVRFSFYSEAYYEPKVARVTGAKVQGDNVGVRNLGESLAPCFAVGYADDPMPLDYVAGVFLRGADGSQTTLEGCYATDFLEVGENEKLKVTGTQWSGLNLLYFYRKDKSYISCFPNVSSGVNAHTGAEASVPEGAYYVRVCYYADYAATQVFAERAYIAETATKKWAGKKWIAFGDSLTEVNVRTDLHYHDYVAQATGIDVINMGSSGTGYMRLQEDGKAFYQRVEGIDTTADVITFFGSGNDLLLWQTAPGTPTDTGTDTVCGCINATLDRLFELAPTMPVGVVSPTPWENGEPKDQNKQWLGYVTALEEICKLRGVPFLNLYYCSNLHPDDAHFREIAYSKDGGAGVHPNEVGHKIIAPRFEAFLNTLLL